MGTVLEAIGNTPIAELRKVAPPGCARIVAKLEWGNPTGSMKDRMARAAIEARLSCPGNRADRTRSRASESALSHRSGSPRKSTRSLPSQPRTPRP